MLNIEKLKALGEKKHINLKTLCTNAVVSYAVIMDKMRKGNELTVTQSENLSTQLNKIITDVSGAIS